MTDVGRSMGRVLSGSSLRGVTGAIALTLAMGCLSQPVLAGATVTGTPDAVRVEADNASVDEVLLALRDAFGLQYQATAKIERKLTGSYSGTLQRVLGRVLEGNDFFLKKTAGRYDVTLLAARQQAGSTATAGTPQGAPAQVASVPAVRSPATPAAVVQAQAPANAPATAPVANPTAAAAPQAATPVVVASAEESKDPVSSLMSPIPGAFVVAEGPAPVATPATVEPPSFTPAPSSVAPPMPTPAPANIQGPTLGPATASAPVAVMPPKTEETAGAAITAPAAPATPAAPAPK